MKYTININYDTGDSFNHYTDQEKEIEHKWENLEVAQQNLNRILEHYKYHLDLNSVGRIHRTKKSIEKLQGEIVTKDWYPDTYPDVSMWLYDDNGGKIHVSTFWTGYFESLNSAEIVPEKNRMKITRYEDF